MKVAIVTTDGQTVSQHFGRSPYYKIVTIENGQIVAEEMRERATGHKVHGGNCNGHGRGGHHGQNSGQHGHGFGPEADQKHATMAAEIADCQILIAGGMGRGAYESFVNAGLNVILTNLVDINAVIKGIINGSLKNFAQVRTD